jgi:hypothetical protein
MALSLTIQIAGVEKPVIYDPDANLIISALREIDGIDISHIILSYSEMVYMQTDGEKLEYQDGSSGNHFYSPSGFQSPEYASQFFLSYMNPKSNWWRKGTQWIKGFPA